MGADGGVATRKVSSTPPDYAEGIVVGLRELLREQGVAPGAIAQVVHGTTVATNAILEGKGARTALITTAGFRDVLELRRIRVPALYDLLYEKPPPLVPRRRRFEVAERIGPRGELWRALDEGSLAEAVERVRACAAEAVAVCLINSYANPAHERRVGAALRAALPGVYVSCSVDVLPEIREYERTSTTVVNAYVGPVVKRYLDSLVERLRAIEVDAPLLVMQSNGGTMSAAAAAERPAYIVESGPAAGVTGAAALGLPNVITLDMGGTTAKASMIEDGQVARTSEYEVGGGINLSSRLVKGGGYALKLPLVDVSEIGAGGGSIVSVVEAGPGAGAPRVGPRSAGADPGPACYARGGVEPTVTDAHVVLGYISPRALAGGRLRLDAEAARRALAERVARPLGLDLLEAAHGAHVIAVATMTRAVKAVSTYQGRDPRDFALLAFGGSGPVCAADLAGALEMRRVIVPPRAGLFSALGLLWARPERQVARTFFRPLGSLAAAEVERVLADLEAEARAGLAGPVELRREAELRYAGQAYELTVAVADGPLEVAALAEAFAREHQRTYGHRAESDPIDLVNLRVVAALSGPPASPSDPHPSPLPEGEGTHTERLAYFGKSQGLVPTPVLARGELGEGRAGPLIVEEGDATCVVPPGASARLDERGNIVMELERG